MHISWYVYILTNYTNAVLYIGVTNNLERRVKEHRRKYARNSFVTRYKLYKLIWYEEFNSPMEAIKVEKKIKGWIRSKKMNLIKEKNPKFVDLIIEE